MSKSVSKLRQARKTPSKAINTDEVFRSNFERPDIDNIILDPELRSFIPAPKPEELVLLEKSIRDEGVRDALLVWKDEDRGYILIDGYNRYSIIKKLQEEGMSVRYSIKPLEFADIESAKDWMIINQLGRRNLTDEQRSYLRGLRYQREKEQHGGERKSSDQNDHLKTSARLADEYKVGEATIRRDRDFAIGLEKIGASNPELKRSILNGEAKINKSLVQKLGKSTDQPRVSFNDVTDILRFFNKKKKQRNHKTPEDTFIESREQIIASLKKLTNQSKAKDIHQIRTMLDKLERLLKS